MYKMEKLYSKEDLIFDGINCERKIPYKIFSTITRDKKMDKDRKSTRLNSSH